MTLSNNTTVQNNLYNTKETYAQNSNKTLSIKDNEAQQTTVNMRNISVNEINELIKSGVDGLLDMVPFIPPSVISQYGSENAKNIKIDFIGQIEKIIEFDKSIGENTDFLYEVLNNLKQIDGMAMPDSEEKPLYG